MQVVGCAEDRVVRVVDISPEPVSAPGRGHELHRALRAGRARAAQLAELRLHEVHGCQHVPLDLESELRLSVVAQQFWCGARAGDLDGLDTDRGSEAIKLTLRGEEISADLCQITRDERECARRETGVAREQSVDPL